MNITAIIIIVLLAIMAGSLVVMAITSVKAGKQYDEDMDEDYATIRTRMDEQAERESQRGDHVA